MDRIEGTAPDWDPVVRWHNFGDSNVDFRVVLRVREFSQQYVLKSEFIKALHKRYNEEGIEISFPMRKIEMSQLPPAPTEGVVG
jgi:small-conductance mechanosensitive channel